MAAQSRAADFREITERGRETWASGDFNQIARQTMMVAEDICRAADPRPGQKVLDVGCGSGNVALVAARRYAQVAGIDLAENLIDRARQRARAEGSEIDFRTGDAQDLPWPDDSFDVVFSVFGVMFAPDQARAAQEILRVCRPGGTIALANWMPEAFGADFFGAHARHAPPPEGVPSPLRWGTEEGINALLGAGLADLELSRQSAFAFYRSVDHALDLFESWFGPTIRAMEVVGEAGAPALRADLARVFETYNLADDGTVKMQTDYLRTLATRT
jgi:SAM-dependent methyltransferase